MRILAVAAFASLLAACAGVSGDPGAFIAPDDCFDLAKHDHPAYVNSCGNER